MVLSNLTLSENTKAEDIKTALENKLQPYLPEGSFTVILRSYQGDFRTRTDSTPNYTAMILVDPKARQAALIHKNEIEALGFRVSKKGDISAN